MDASRQYENIIFDVVIIACALVTLLVSVLTLLLMFFSRARRENNEVNSLLTANPLISLVITSLFAIDMYGYTLYGHLHPNNFFDGWWCKLKSSLRYSSGASFMYSLFLHAAYRFCRIVLPMQLRLQSIRIYQFAIVIQWLFCLLSILLLLFLGDIRYVKDDFNCQVELTNIRGMLILMPIVYCIPSSLATICYNYTLYYYRKRNTIRVDIGQQMKNRRDMIVLKRIFMILAFMIIIGLPILILCIVYYISHQLPWWTRPVGWLSVALSYGCVPFILIIASPQLRKLWTQPWHRIHP